MVNVAYIKQKAIEIANNSSHKIIIGVMNHQDVCADIIDQFDNISEHEELDQYLSPSFVARQERRNKRQQERLARRRIT